jgi:hypothetical protein
MPKGIPINESALRDVEAAAIGQQVLVFEAATGGIDEAFDRRLGGNSRAIQGTFFVEAGGLMSYGTN